MSGTSTAEWSRCGDDKNEFCPAEPAQFKTTKPITFKRKKGDFDDWTAERRNDDPGANQAANSRALDDLKKRQPEQEQKRKDLEKSGGPDDEKERLKKQVEDART